MSTATNHAIYICIRKLWKLRFCALFCIIPLILTVLVWQNTDTLSTHYTTIATTTTSTLYRSPIGRFLPSPTPKMYMNHHQHPPFSNNHTKLILYWTSLFDDPTFDIGFGTSPFTHCPVSNCFTTTNRSLFNQSDIVLFHGRSMTMSDLPAQRWMDQLFVFNLQEPPVFTYLNLKLFDDFFNATMTYHRGADVVYPYAVIAPGVQEGAVPEYESRTSAASWVASHCDSQSHREDYVKRLQHHLQVDTFGACGSLTSCPGDTPGAGARVAGCYQRLAHTHFFHLAFENSLCEDYITEKFWTALQVGLVPVVMGPGRDSYLRVAPPDSFIHVDDFPGPEQLAAYLFTLMHDPPSYANYFAWRGRFKVQHAANVKCDLCAFAHQQHARPRKTVRISHVWGRDTQCTEPENGW